MSYCQPFYGDYPITQRYGETITDPKGHSGIDYACPEGTVILAAADGIVMRAGWDSTGYGNMVIILHDSKTSTLYAHLRDIRVFLNQKVRQGDVIGQSGSTGNSTGAHLHFEARHIWNDYKTHFDPIDLPLMSFADVMIPEPAELKETDEFREGDLLKVVCRDGVKAFYNPSFEGFTTYPKNFPFYYTGEKTVRKSNGLEYMKVVPANFGVWIAVNDGDVQLLDK